MLRSLTRALLLPSLLLLLAPAWGGQYLTILHFNDFHGHLEPTAPDAAGHSSGGLARLATVADRVRAWNSAHSVPTLLLEAGDMLQGTPLSSAFKGEPDFECLSRMGVTAMCLGNHEFDFGLDVLQARRKQARFPVGSANVTQAGRRLCAEPFLLVPAGEETAAIIPLTTPETKVESAARNVEGVDFADPAQTVRDLLPRLPARARFLVVLSHLGLDADLKLAAAVPEIDVIIGGHSHDALAEPRRIGQTLICQAGAEAKYLGELDLYVENGQVERYRGFLHAINERVPARPDLAAYIKSYSDRLTHQLAQVLGEAAVPLVGDRDTIRKQETNLGNLVADAMREYAGTEVAMTNAGGIRASVDVGPITLGEVITVMPFENGLNTLELTGEQLRQVMQRHAELPAADGGFLQVSGLRCVIRGGKVSAVEVGGVPVEPGRHYTVATNDFLSTGGNGYTAFAAGRNLRDCGITVNEVFKRYLRQHGRVAPKLEGRLVIEP